MACCFRVMILPELGGTVGTNLFDALAMYIVLSCMRQCRFSPMHHEDLYAL